MPGIRFLPLPSCRGEPKEAEATVVLRAARARVKPAAASDSLKPQAWKRMSHLQTLLTLLIEGPLAHAAFHSVQELPCAKGHCLQRMMAFVASSGSLLQ
mmetsp:Transcript_5700/g.10194  ORF Transcript_5700/g.10194 Transcript_5700/m.10194 type:complete len:99 (-) Transcript_5700:17-313(-)